LVDVDLHHVHSLSLEIIKQFRRGGGKVPVSSGHRKIKQVVEQAGSKIAGPNSKLTVGGAFVLHFIVFSDKFAGYL
jgi:hypothetical protein